MTRYPIAKARDRLATLVHEVEPGPAVELTGRPVAVLLTVAEYRSPGDPRRDFVDALHRFRENHDLRSLELEEAWSDVRDPSTGCP